MGAARTKRAGPACARSRLVRVLSLLVGRACDFGDGAETYRTAFRKRAVVGPALVGPLGLEGDEQVHGAVHGGPDRALLAYPARHYEAFVAEGCALPHGSFGENLVVEGLDEGSVCIGDRHRIGGALLEVSVPRTPCRAISLVNERDDLFERVLATGRVGWLYRVIEEGVIAAGDAIELGSRGDGLWTIPRAADVMARVREKDPTAIVDGRALAEVGTLANAWRTKLAERLEAMAPAPTP